MTLSMVQLRHRVRELKTGPFGSALSANEYVADGIPLLNPSDLIDGRIDIHKAVRVPELVAIRMADYRVKSGDVVLARRGELGRYGLVGDLEDGYLCGTGSLLVRPGGQLSARFFGYYLETSQARAWLSLQSVGSTMENLSEGILARFPVPDIRISDQERIANFLDEQTARIDALIAEKGRLVGTVREYEQSELSRILTQGLTSHPLIPTGRPFITRAPVHWRVTAFKRALMGLGQGWSPQCEGRPAEAHEWGVLKVGCVNGTSFNANENKALPPSLEPDLTCVLQRGDVLVSRANTRELVGLAALVEDEHPNLLMCDKLYRLRLRTDWVTPEFSVLLLRSDAARRQIELGASGASSSMQNISQDVIRELLVALPPIAEQMEIVSKARQIRESCNVLVGHCTEHIDRLREYRSSLISAAVTGQMELGGLKVAA